MTRLPATTLVAILFFLSAGWANADIGLLTQNFDSMGSSGTAPPAGWSVGHLNPVKNRDTVGGEGAAIVSETLLVDNGSTDGGTNGYSFNYGTTGSGDRALGNIPRTTNGDHIIQVAITNNTGYSLASLRLTYTGEQWRRGQSAAAAKPEKLMVFLSTSSSTSGFVSMGAAFDFNALQDAPGQAQIALDGNASANRTVISGTYTPAAPIANGAVLYIRWYDWNDDATMDHGLAIDDVAVTGTPVAGLAVSTLDATDVQQNSATLNGQLTDLGGESSAQVWFQWGASSSNLNQSTTPQTLTAPGGFTAPLAGLTPETVYYFKAMATAGTKSAEGAVRSFLWTDNYGLQFNGTNSHVTMGPAPGLATATFTVEAWFKRTGTGSTANSGSGGVDAVPLVCKGVGEGDGSNIDANYFFGIRATDNVLAADFEDMASGLNHPVAGVTAIQNNIWYHAAATYDGTTWRLYLNGLLEAELAVSATPRYDSIQHFGLGTAMNSTGAQSGRFDGVLDEVRVWNYARNQAEILADINTEITSPTPNLLGRWGLDEGSGTAVADSSGNGNHGTMVNALWSLGAPFNANLAPDSPILVEPPNGSDVATLTAPLTVHVSDNESEAMQVKFYGRKLAAAPAPPFRIVAVPDTQNYSMTYPQTFIDQITWIKNNRQSLNIVYVGHEGDIVNNSDQPTQWTNANNAISIYDTIPELPFGLAMGNHDENPNGSPSGTTEFNTYFPYTRYSGRSWYGGHYGSNNDNHYILFSAGGMDFIAIHFQYDPAGPAAAMTWAGNLLQNQYPNRRAIVVAHSILETTAAWTTQGGIIYNALKVYPNLFLMLCGHNHGEAMRTDVYNNRTVYSLLADYQDWTNGGNGYLRILEFVPADNAISVKTYSPTLAQYETDANSQFSLTYDMSGQFVELGMVSGVASDTDAVFNWANLEPRRTYEWYTTVSDGHSLTTGPVWTFAIPTPPVPEITLVPTTIDRTVHALNDLADDTFTVANTGAGALNYAITSDAHDPDWLSIQPADGASTGEADSIRIIYDVAGLSAGTHTAHITVASGDAWNSPQTVTVTVHVGTVRPDLDLDGDVDQADFGVLQACLAGPGMPVPGPQCANADLNDDDSVGSGDIAVLQGCIAGANMPTNPQCDD
jgi:hypothetical protein